MKKIFFSFVALCAFTLMSSAATTVNYVVGDTATKYSWESLSQHPTLQIDANISVNATHDAASQTYTNGTYSKSQWYAYMADNNGEFSIDAAEGYRIYSVAFKINALNGGTLVEKITRDTISNDSVAYLVNNESIAFNVVKSYETTNLVTSRIKTFTVVYDTLPASVSAEDMTVKVGQHFQLTANVTPATLFNQVTWVTNAPNIVDIDANGMINVKAVGQATITATTINGKQATCTITAEAASEDIAFTESYANLGEQVDWKKTFTEYIGAMDQSFRVRNYRFSNATEFTTGVPGVELQYLVDTKTINFIAYANDEQEGGAKAIAFEWRAVDGTKPVIFDVDSTQNKTTMNLVSLPANGGYENVQSFAKELGFEQNMQLRIRIADAASSNIVFGPITITPYLLYKQREDTVETPIESYDCADADLLINNVDGDVTYSIQDDTSEAATISNGVLDLSAIEDACDIAVQASWKGVKTIFKLHVNKGTSTKLDNSEFKIQASKLVKDGQLVIIRGSKSYSVLGTSLSK